MKILVEKAEKVVKAFLEHEGTGHDWFHIERVRNMAKRLAKETDGCDVERVELIALLHDMGDYKLHDGSHEKGAAFLRKTLEVLTPDKVLQEDVFKAINEISFKGAGVETKVSSKEAAVVQDADRLDAIGAIGVARAFAYGGSKNRLLHHPRVKAEEHQSFEAYSSAEGTTVNHFYEKLLLLKDRMNTQAAKSLAQQRHAFMEEFLAHFYAEWKGER